MLKVRGEGAAGEAGGVRSPTGHPRESEAP